MKYIALFLHPGIYCRIFVAPQQRNQILYTWRDSLAPLSDKAVNAYISISVLRP